MIYAVSWCGFEEHRLRLGWRLSIGFLEFQDGDLLGGEECVPLVCRSGELSQNVGIAPIKFDGLRRTRFFQPCQAGSWNVTMFMSHMSGYCLPFAPLPESDRVWLMEAHSRPIQHDSLQSHVATNVALPEVVKSRDRQCLRYPPIPLGTFVVALLLWLGRHSRASWNLRASATGGDRLRENLKRITTNGFTRIKIPRVFSSLQTLIATGFTF